MSNYLFSDFIREQHPLHGLMDEEARTARRNAEGIRPDEFVTASDTELIDRLTVDWRRFAQKLSRRKDPDPRPEPRPCDRRNDTASTRYWRWSVKFPLTGNLELLQAWPAAWDMEPCGSDLHHEPAPEMIWEITPGGPIVMLDVPQTDDETGEIVPRDRIVAATKFLDQFIELVNPELDQYEQQLIQDLAEAVATRRKLLGRIKQQITETIELVARECPPLLIETIAEDQHIQDDVTLAHSPVTLSFAIKPETFTDLVRICRQWIDSAQRYPSTYASLKEEDITSTLVTALNLVFDTAHREVFIGGGKSDIYVEVEHGDPTRKAYVGEAKFWDGQGEVDENLKQVLRYTPSHVRHAILLYYVHEKNIDLIRERGTAAIQRYSTNFRHWKDDIAVLQHSEFNHEIQLAILYAHFPRQELKQPH
ncbi:MAG: hypothetical protein M3Y48_13290 [Actinomycetota bacterium]|nr:hypothetical protein [Actinomycetota bacterium]